VLEVSGVPAGEPPLIDRPQIAAALRGTTVRASEGLGTDAGDLRVLAVRLPGSPGRVIVVATSLDTVDASVSHLTVLLLLAGPALLVIAGFGGWWLAGSGVVTVSRMTKQASQIGGGTSTNGSTSRTPPTRSTTWPSR
jgi:hypothetical protein